MSAHPPARRPVEKQSVDSIPTAPVVGDDQQRAAGLEGVAFAGDVGVLDAGPRLDQGHRRRALFLARRDQETVSVRGDDHALVEQHVFLEAALEVVAEGRVRAAAVGNCAVVGLHEAALADLVVLDLLADGHDAADDFVSRHGGLAAGHVARHAHRATPARCR